MYQLKLKAYSHLPFFFPQLYLMYVVCGKCTDTHLEQVNASMGLRMGGGVNNGIESVGYTSY